MAVTTNTNTGTTTTTTMDLKRKVVDEDGISSKTTNKKRVASTTSDEKGRTEIICSALAEKCMDDENDDDDDDEDDDDYVEDDDEDDSDDGSDDDSDVGSEADDSDEDNALVDVGISVPAPVIKWAKSGPGIVISDEECLLRRGYQFVPHLAERKYHQRHHAGSQLVITNITRDWLLATGNVELGGADGVREGYFEVELTADEDDEDMEMMIFVGVVQNGAALDHAVHGGVDKTPHWYLCANDGSLCGKGKSFEDKQGQLDVGDRVGVLVNLDNGAGGDGGSVRFFVNGAEYGPGFKSGVIGPVVLGAELTVENQVLTLLPDAQKPAGNTKWIVRKYDIAN